MAKGRVGAQNLNSDPLIKQYVHASAWAKDRSRPILTWLIAAVVVLAVGLIAWMLLSRRSSSAAESLSRAMAVHDAMVQNPLPVLAPGMVAFTTEEEKHKKAYEALEQAAREYPSFHGDLARYLAATHQLTFESEKAEATLKEIAGKNSDVSSQARLALASRYEAVGKNDDALAEYQKLKSSPGSVPPALIDSNIARIYEATGKAQEAVNLYLAIVNNKDLRTTTLGRNAETRLAVLAPEKLDALPPPEPSNPMAGMGGLFGR